MSLMARRAGLMGSKKCGKEIVLLASGIYTKTDAETVPGKLEIPVSISGTPHQILIIATELSALAETCRWNRYYATNPETITYANMHTHIFGYHSAGQTSLTWGASPYGSAGHVAYSNGKITAQARDSGYKVQNNTFNWYVWGYRE